MAALAQYCKRSGRSARRSRWPCSTTPCCCSESVRRRALWVSERMCIPFVLSLQHSFQKSVCLIRKPDTSIICIRLRCRGVTPTSHPRAAFWPLHPTQDPSGRDAIGHRSAAHSPCLLVQPSHDDGACLSCVLILVLRRLVCILLARGAHMPAEKPAQREARNQPPSKQAFRRCP